jgi:hypothetical protein
LESGKHNQPDLRKSGKHVNHDRFCPTPAIAVYPVYPVYLLKTEKYSPKVYPKKNTYPPLKITHQRASYTLLEAF